MYYSSLRGTVVTHIVNTPTGETITLASHCSPVHVPIPIVAGSLPADCSSLTAVTGRQCVWRQWSLERVNLRRFKGLEAIVGEIDFILRLTPFWPCAIFIYTGLGLMRQENSLRLAIRSLVLCHLSSISGGRSTRSKVRLTVRLHIRNKSRIRGLLARITSLLIDLSAPLHFVWRLLI